MSLPSACDLQVRKSRFGPGMDCSSCHQTLQITANPAKSNFPFSLSPLTISSHGGLKLCASSKTFCASAKFSQELCTAPVAASLTEKTQRRPVETLKMPKASWKISWVPGISVCSRLSQHVPATWMLENNGSMRTFLFKMSSKGYVDRGMVMFQHLQFWDRRHFRAEPSTDGRFAGRNPQSKGISLSPRRIWGSLTPRFQRCGHVVVRVKTLWLLLLNLPELLVKLGNQLCPVWPEWSLHTYLVYIY